MSNNVLCNIVDLKLDYEQPVINFNVNNIMLQLNGSLHKNYSR